MTRVHVSIGSNQERERHVRAAVAALAAAFGRLELSGVWETPAVGFDGEPFYNLAAGFDTDLALEPLLDRLKAIERAAGRVPGQKRFGPRTLDIDVLTFGDRVCDGPVRLPRDEIVREAYVLGPLAELAPDARHPVLGERYRDLEARLGLDDRGMRRVALDLPVEREAS